MSYIVSITDFETGTTAIATDNFTEEELQTAIDTYELTLLYEMLGVELCDLFIADLDDGEPQTQRFIDIFNAWFKDINGDLIQSLGIKQMLVKWIFFFYVRQQSQVNTISGNEQSESSINYFSKMGFATLVNEYNYCISTFKSIQRYIIANGSTYPEYKGIHKDYISI
jgi:hypothetical protein